MNELIERLRAWGCDIDGAMERMLDDQELFVTCVQMVAEDPGFDELGRQLTSGTPEAAFDVAHSLKGVTANTRLTPLYTLVGQLVEPLRRGRSEGLLCAYHQLMDKKAELDAILQDALQAPSAGQ